MRSNKSSLLFVYNADSGLMNAVLDSAHKLLAPQAPGCGLCALTYSAFSMHRRWKAFLDSLGVPVELLHRDELAVRFGWPAAALPAVFLRTGSTLEEVISAGQIHACTGLDDLILLVRAALGRSAAAQENRPAARPLRLDLLLNLAHLLLPGDRFLDAKIELAAHHPQAYLRASLSDGRHDPESFPPGELPWQALIQGLDRGGRLVSIDWQLPPGDVLVQLGRLLPQETAQQAWTWWQLDRWRRRPTFDFLVAVARRLRGPRRSLAWFPLEGDWYPVLLSAPEEIEQASLLADRSGFGQIAPLAPPARRPSKSGLPAARTGL